MVVPELIVWRSEGIIDFSGPQSNIETITNKINVSEVSCDQMSRKKGGDESRNYFPPIPPTRIPFFINPGPLLSRFLDFLVFQFFGSFLAHGWSCTMAAAGPGHGQWALGAKPGAQLPGPKAPQGSAPGLV